MLLAVLDNAVKFTPAGKRVSLSMEGHTVIVADGDRIPEEELAHIFERFRRTRGGNAQERGSASRFAAGGAAARHPDRRGQPRFGGHDLPLYLPRRRQMNT